MRITVFKLVLYVVFGISAVIGLFVFATYTGTNDNETFGEVVIWGTLPRDGVESLLATMGQTNTNFNNVSYIEKNPATLPSELASAIATGLSPDLVLDSQENLLALARYISPIPESTLSASTFTSTFARGGEIYRFAGGYYGIPFLIDPLVLFSNRQILSTAGIARPPGTWEALVGLVPTVTVLADSRSVTRGLIALGTYDNVQNARGILSTLFLQMGVPISSLSGTGFLTGNLGQTAAGGVPPGESVLSFYTQFADPTKISYTWNASLANSQRMFINGDLALYIGYASEARFLQESNPNLNFIVTPIPQPSAAEVRNAYGLIYAFMISRGAKNPAGAYQIAALLSNDTEQSVAVSATGLAPATLNQLSVVPADPTMAVAYRTALYAHGWLSPASGDTDRLFGGMINDVISGRLDIESALSKAELSLGTLLRR